jgi:putative endonuclease
MENTVYILHSATLNRYYIGFTTNFDLRLEFHFSDEQTRKFTHKANDWEVFLTVDCSSKKQGLFIEKHIKNMKSKIYIENLKKYPEITSKLLLKYTDC